MQLATKLAGGAAALAIGAAMAAAQPLGVFKVEGVNPDGTTYSGQVEITSSGETYNVTWTIAGATFTGAGLYTDGVFSTAYTGGFTGLAAYEEIAPGVWSGPWAGVGASEIGQESWTSVGSDGAPRK